MKNFILSIVLSLFCVTYSFAYDVLIGGIYYNLDKTAKTAEVTSGTTFYSGEKQIPSVIKVNGIEYSVTSIASWTFGACPSLTSVTIPNSVTSIGSYAFSDCPGLTSMNIPNSVKSIGENAFNGCYGLTSFVVDGNNQNYSSADNVLFNKNKTELIYCISGRKGEYTIPNTVTCIKKYAFSYCIDITSVTIPNSVTTIEKNAFGGCTGLTSLTIPNSVTSIEDLAFYWCSNISDLTWGANGNDISLITKYCRENLKKVTILDNVTSIGRSAFESCTNLTSVTIGNNVTIIENNAFRNCTSLASVTITKSVEIIGDNAFYSCTGIKSVTIGNSVTNIGNNAFFGCTGITSVTIPNSVTNIGNFAFYLCTGITSVTIPNSVTNIGNYAFYGCSGITSVVIPNSVTNIGYDAFYGCSRLTSMTIGNSVKSIGIEAFGACSNLTTLVVDENNPSYFTFDNVLFNKNKTELIYCANGKKGEYTIPNSVTSIGGYAFTYCQKLTSVIIPNSVTNIGNNAFQYCSGITSIIIPDFVTNIGDNAFRDCSNLSSITIGSSVKNIGSMTFYSCNNIETVTCLATTVPSTGSNVFMNYYINKATLIIPEALLQSYKTTDPWSMFGTFKTVEGGDVPTTKKCEKPTISYENGELLFTTETEGAEIVSEIKDNDIKKHYTSRITLSATYDITAYATRSGYDDSDIATATLIWLDARLDGTSTDAKEITVNAKPLLITQDAGIVTISGLQDGEKISAFDASGKQIATSRAIGAETMIDLSSQQGKAAIINIGGKSVKLMIK